MYGLSAPKNRATNSVIPTISNTLSVSLRASSLDVVAAAAATAAFEQVFHCSLSLSIVFNFNIPKRAQTERGE